jgi:hypothetical protein
VHDIHTYARPIYFLLGCSSKIYCTEYFSRGIWPSATNDSMEFMGHFYCSYIKVQLVAMLRPSYSRIIMGLGLTQECTLHMVFLFLQNDIFRSKFDKKIVP